MFRCAADRFQEEEAHRKELWGRILKFGVSYLDDALLGILPNDLVLIGAPSGAGKTQLCVNIANANLAEGKRVHVFALEAEQDEWERRIKYQMLCQAYYSDQNRQRLNSRMTFQGW